MSGISSGVGIISGIDIQGLVDQLIALEARPVDILRERISAIDVRRTALLGMSAQLLAIENAITPFTNGTLFNQFDASSSNEQILSATASSSAIPSTQSFRVRSLVTSHSLVSRGFADVDKTPVGAGTISIEVGQGGVRPQNRLDDLFAGGRFRRGIISITDRAGNSADIDLSAAVTVSDVLDAINGNTSINLRARVTGNAFGAVTGDRIVLEDLSTTPTGNLIITDKEGHAANDLGLTANVAASRVDGTVDLVRLSKYTPLSALNDGNGIDGVGGITLDDDLLFSRAGHSFTVSLANLMTDDTDLRTLNSGNGVNLGVIRVTDRGGRSVDIDLADPAQPVRTAGELRDRISAALTQAGVQVSMSMSTISTGEEDLSRFLLNDSSVVDDDSEATFSVEDVTGTAAADLGIAQETTDSSIVGQGVYRIATVGDLINAINYAAGNGDQEVRASISDDGNGIKLVALGALDTYTVTGVEGSNAAEDLGLADLTFSAAGTETRHLMAGLDTVLLRSLHGGAGVTSGTVNFTDKSGVAKSIDFTGVQSLQGVIDLINDDPDLGLLAEVNNAGNGIAIRDTSGGAGSILISDASGTLAADLGILSDGTSGEGFVSGQNLQLQYVSRATRLSDLNGGNGISFGRFGITDSNGATVDVVIPETLRTVGDVIDQINRQAGDGVAIEARINDNGDGIVVVDSGGGTGQLSIVDREGGQMAADLRLAGEAAAGETQIDGSYETTIEIGAADTLEDIVAKIAESGAPVSATVLNDGSSINPHSLTFTSLVSGAKGELFIDGVGVDLGLTTIAEARDAVVTVGAGGSISPIVVSAPSNTFENLLEGVTIDALAIDDEEVTVTVNQDIDSIVEAIQSFVDRYNDVQSAIDEETSFDPETFAKGPLFGDSTVDVIRNRLQRTLLKPFTTSDSRISRLFSVGIRVGSGARLEFDEEKFRDAYADSPEAVEALFATEESGFGAVMTEVLEGLTDDFDGLITSRNEVLGDQQELLDDRIERLNEFLDAKRLRLEAQFAAMESSLAALQGQQSSLAALAQLTSA